MGVEIRLPQITGVSEREQLQQLKSYIYQLREQLQWAFDNIDTTGGSGGGYVVNQTSAYSSSSGSTKIDAEATFAAIKALIIKSADIVDAYYEEINARLEGAYVAESDFGTFAEKTALEIEANSTSITQNYENVQIIIRENKEEIEGEFQAIVDAAKETKATVENLGTGLDDANNRIGKTEDEIQKTKDDFNSVIQTVTNSLSEADRLLHSVDEQLKGSIDNLRFDLTGLREIVVGVTAYVKSGLLYSTKEGIPVYGIEIGQEVEANGETAFKKYARFTSEKLSFYDANDNEVAYISDKKLYIGQAEITVSLKVGGLVDLVMNNGDVVTKWEGVSG
jgi:hypothetical protein